jgi:hypothetical protein
MDDLFAGGGGRTVGTLVGILVVLALMARRFSQTRPLKIERLWIRPAIFMVIVLGALVSLAPPLTVANIGLLLAAAAVGSAVGWQRGRFMRIEVHPETHDVTTRASPWAMVFIIGLMGARVLLRGALADASVPGVSAVAVTDALILLAGTIMSVSNLEMWLRARRLLAQAQAARLNPSLPDRPLLS